MTDYRRLEHANPDHADWVVVNWCVGNTCNFACSYCPTSLHDGSHPWADLEVALRFVDHVMQHYAGRKVYIELTGGEITQWRHLPAVCRHIRSYGYWARVGIISNGSRTLRWWREHMDDFDHVCLSFHSEEGVPDHFLAVATLLHQNLRLHVNIMMHPERFALCQEVAERIVALGDITLSLQPLRVDLGGDLFAYSPEQDRVLREQASLYGDRVRRTHPVQSYRGNMAEVYPDGRREVHSANYYQSRGTNGWAGWLCWAGVDQIIVDMDGVIYRGWCKVGGRIGHITDPQPRFPTAPTLCTKAVCPCNFDIMVPKEQLTDLGQS